MEFPLVDRELTRSGKRVMTYVVRVVIVGFPVLFVGFMWLVTLGAPVYRAEEFASMIVGICTFFQLVAVFGVTPLLTAGTISEERQERTLGLLIIADFRGWDIFFAKFLSVFIQVELLVLSPLPLFAFASFLGGIPVPEMAVMVVLLSSLVLVNCAIGILSSCLVERPGEALLLTILGMFLWIVGTGELDGWVPLERDIAPVNALSAMARIDEPGAGLVDWLPSVLCAVVFSAVLAAITIAILPYQAVERPARPPRRRGRRRLIRRLFRNNPAVQLVSAYTGEFRGTHYSLRAIAVLGLCAMAAMFFCFAWPLILLLICYSVCSSVAAAKRTGALDDILVTPLENEALARALFIAHMRAGAYYFPALLFCGLMPLFWVIGDLTVFSGYSDFVLTAPLTLGTVLEMLVMATLMFTVYFAFFLAQFINAVAVACFSSMLSETPVRQTAFAIFMILLLHVLGGAFISIFVGIPMGVIADSELVPLGEFGVLLGFLIVIATAIFIYLLTAFGCYRMFAYDFSITLRVTPPPQVETRIL
ncbi:MAG: hypothetical protein HY706_08585 [Candidatus Hydrogenedentes bacterium]|nr:hypothetical protein [Candidatus Hydrogenedentota bacterium]